MDPLSLKMMKVVNGSLSVIDINVYTNDEKEGDIIASIMIGEEPSDVTVNPY